MKVSQAFKKMGLVRVSKICLWQVFLTQSSQKHYFIFDMYQPIGI